MGNNPTRHLDRDGRFCRACPDASLFQAGEQFIFDSDGGAHAGSVYDLVDPSLGQGGWVRIDGMVDGLTVIGSPMGYYEAKM